MIALRMGTRGSTLALWQAQWVADLLTTHYRNIDLELVTIKSTGDERPDLPLSNHEHKGLFTDKIEAALLDGSIDLAVHSLKDLPTQLPDDLKIAAYCVREDPRDVFISRTGEQLEALEPGSVIGTSSLRRKAQLLKLRPDLVCVDIRGNVETRLRKLAESTELAGVIVAAAGVIRIGRSNAITQFLDEEHFLPAPGQGVVAVEIAERRDDMQQLLQSINHLPSEYEARAERTFLQILEGGCRVPIGARAVFSQQSLQMQGMVSSLDGSTVIRVQSEGVDPAVVGSNAAELALKQGAAQILKEILC